MNTKKMKKSISRVALLPATVLLSLVTAVGAHAADLSVAPLYKAPPAPVAPPPYNWSGFYLGVNGGGGWSTSHWDSFGSTNGSGGVPGRLHHTERLACHRARTRRLCIRPRHALCDRRPRGRRHQGFDAGLGGPDPDQYGL